MPMFYLLILYVTAKIYEVPTCSVQVSALYTLSNLNFFILL